MKRLKRLYYRMFPTYRKMDTAFVSYNTANEMILRSDGKPEREQWGIDIHHEDMNTSPGFVYLCRRERIWE